MHVRVIVIALLIVGLAVGLAGCSEEQNSQLPPGAERVDINTFPTGIGRGYPQGLLDDEGPPELWETGMTPPEFTLLLPDGRHTSLSDLKGRPVLINFWATWCPPCRAEMPELLEAARDYPDLVMLAVNVSESPAEVSQFAEQFRMDVPVVIDPTGTISDRYNITGLPTSVFLDADGTISSVRPGAINRAVIDGVLGR